MTVFSFGIIKKMKFGVYNRRNEILNQKYLIYFFCLLIVLFFITIKYKEHHCSCGGEAGSLGDDRLSTILLRPPYEWFIYALDVLF